MKCEEPDGFECKNWKPVNIPFRDLGDYIVFHPPAFSAYAGSNITILNVQSYPQVGGNWTVRFTTTGQANLTITAVNGTTWTNYSDQDHDLKFLEIKCGNQTLSYQWINTSDNCETETCSVFIPDYYCNETGHEVSKVLTGGTHILEFTFGEDTEYARNQAEYTCDSCESCTDYLTNGSLSAGDILKLTADIINYAGLNDSTDPGESCIKFGGADNIIFDCNGKTISGDGDNYGYGIWLNDSLGGSNNNTIKNCGNISYFYYGIYFESSDNNTLQNITANSNSFGIHLYSSSNTLQNITVQENQCYDIYFYASSPSDCNNLFQNVTGSGDRPIEYYNYSINLENKTFSELVLCNASNSNITNITIIGSDTKKNNALLVYYTNNSNFKDINSSYNYYGIYLSSSNTNTLQNITANSNECGISLSSSNTNTLQNITAKSNSVYGIILFSSSNTNTLQNITANSNWYGISLSSNTNTLQNITANSNQDYGIYLSSSSNTLQNITANSNSKYGIYLSSSDSNTLQNITAKENHYYDIFFSPSSSSDCNNIFQNVTGSGDRPIEYYNYSVDLQNKTLAELILCNASNSNITNITISGSDTYKNNGLLVYYTSNSNFKDINSSYNYYGIYLYSSSSNNITGSAITSSSSHGIYISNYASDNNLFYNNFLNNTNNFHIASGADNYWNTTLNCSSGPNIIGGPCIGGNYWAKPD
ncbi:MAG: hypothetical protein DRP16_05375, partial [Candidatus Aenigmatarchaeota archaeon]